jgi:anti-anti-sigma factor
MSTPTTPDRCLIRRAGLERPLLVLTPAARALRDDAAAEAWYRDAADAAAWARTARVVLDLGQVDYLAGIGLSKVLRLYRDLTQAGGRLVLCRAAPTLLEVIRIVRLDRVLTVCGGLQEAVDAAAG